MFCILFFSFFLFLQKINQSTCCRFFSNKKVNYWGKLQIVFAGDYLCYSYSLRIFLLFFFFLILNYSSFLNKQQKNNSVYVLSKHSVYRITSERLKNLNISSVEKISAASDLPICLAALIIARKKKFYLQWLQEMAIFLCFVKN